MNKKTEIGSRTKTKLDYPVIRVKVINYTICTYIYVKTKITLKYKFQLSLLHNYIG